MVLLRPEWSVAALAVAVLTCLAAIALSQTARRRWWLPAALLGTSLVALTMAWARPATWEAVPRTPVAVAVDVSPSMGADDVGQTRLQAARVGLRAWLQTLPAEQRVSLTSFSGTVTQLAPALPAPDVVPLLDRLVLGRSTAVGDGLTAAAQTLREPGHQLGSPVRGTVVVLSDGTTNTGPSGNQVAKNLLGDGIRVDAVALGTDKGVVTIDGAAQPVPLDDAELKAAATANGGRLTTARNADDVARALAQVDPVRGYQVWDTPLRVLAALLAAGAVIALRPWRRARSGWMGS